jgi:hypothetical protein
MTSVPVLGTSVLLLSTSDGALFEGIRPPDGGAVSIPASSLSFILSTNININDRITNYNTFFFLHLFIHVSVLMLEIQLPTGGGLGYH